MKHRLMLAAVSVAALLAFLTVLGRSDVGASPAGTFNPELTATLEDPEPEANSSFTTDFNLPSGDVNFAGVVSFIPREWGIVPGGEIPIGAVVGELTAQATLGLINAACSNALPVTFTMLNSSVDTTDTVPFIDADDEGTEDYAEDRDESGLQDGFERYPEFITRVLVDENDEPLQPVRRAAGITIVAGINVLLQFLVFEPGTVIDEEIPSDESLGYPTVTLLQNVGDPATDPEPGPITDFCTPLTSTNTTFGMSKDNPCTDADTPREQLDPICEARSVTFEVPDEPTTDPDESGHVLFANPQDAEYTFTTIALGQRDADGDGIENALDTCAFDPNVGDPRINADGDADEDGLDAACDPDDSLTNSDEDLDGYLNRGDNCPLDPNGEESDNQRDTDDDTIGDACDPNPDDPDTEGELASAQVSETVTIGTGTGDPAPPSAEACPTCLGIGEGGDGAADGDDDDGGSGTLIIIIVAVVAGVVVVGGGAFFLMRRGGGSGGAPA